MFLLGASYYFYMCWKAEYVIIIALGTIADYYIAMAISRSPSNSRKKQYLYLSLFCNLGALFLFKYLNFFSDTLKVLLSQFSIFYNARVFNLLLPVGISYYTFKKISYVVDVYRENQEPERHLGRFSLYVSFFPALATGPIDRARDLLPQFTRAFNFEYERVISGLKLIIWGLFKKVVVADRLAIFTDYVFSHPEKCDSAALFMTVFFYSVQIYADFSGYTDMAIGVAQILGYRLTDNFNRPYFSKSIGQFWKRWHISLSSWLMDYLFLPMAYAISRRIKSDKLLYIKAETWAYVIGICITMLLCGLWHGAKWTYVAWGGLHGVYLVLSFITKGTRKKIRKNVKKIGKWIGTPYDIARILFTFFTVSFLWIFFRSDSISRSVLYIRRMVELNFSSGSSIPDILEKINGFDWFEFSMAIIAICILLAFHLLEPHSTMRNMLKGRRPLWYRWVVYYIILFSIIFFSVSATSRFIYLQF